MSKTFTIVKVAARSERAFFANLVTISPDDDRIIFHDNTTHCYKGLLTLFKLALNAANDKGGLKPNYTVIENDEKNILTIQGDSEYVVKMCKRICMFDEKSAEDMLDYLRNPRSLTDTNKCTFL